MRNFNLSEFDSRDEEGSGRYMDESFLLMIDDARDYANRPFVITSGYRTEAHNREVGGSPTSSHLFGYAADISCADSESRIRMVYGLMKAGFRRIGIASNFIHVDNDPKKPKALWLYK